MTLINSSSPTVLSQNATEFPGLIGEAFKQGLQVFIALFGIIGNILVIVIVTKQPKQKTTTDFYIQILSVADLLMLSVNFPLAVIMELLPTNWPFGEFTCLYLFPIPDTFYGASVWTIVAIAVERYRGIVLGAPIRGKTALKRVKKTATYLWVVSFLVFSLPLYFSMKYEEKPMDKLCTLVWPRRFIQTYTIVLMLCSYVLPLACICWTCVQVHRCLQRSNLFIKTMFDGNNVTTLVQKSLSQSQERRLTQNKRAHRILTPVAVVFAVSMLPLTVLRTVLSFWFELYDQKCFPHLFYVAAFGAIINSAANPVIYSFGCKEFRLGLKQLFCRV